jgi:hypothetical protein
MHSHEPLPFGENGVTTAIKINANGAGRSIATTRFVFILIAGEGAKPLASFLLKRIANNV